MAKQRINQAQQNNTVNSLTNTGTGGGTMYYLNLGNIKILWGTTNSISTSNSVNNSWGVTFPSSFFTTIQMGIANVSSLSTETRQYAYINGYSTTSCGGLIINAYSTAGSSAIVSYYFMGT